MMIMIMIMTMKPHDGVEVYDDDDGDDGNETS